MALAYHIAEKIGANVARVGRALNHAELHTYTDLVAQSQKTIRSDVMKVKDQKVRLLWKKEHVRYVGG